VSLTAITGSSECAASRSSQLNRILESQCTSTDAVIDISSPQSFSDFSTSGPPSTSSEQNVVSDGNTVRNAYSSLATRPPGECKRAWRERLTKRKEDYEATQIKRLRAGRIPGKAIELRAMERHPEWFPKYQAAKNDPDDEGAKTIEVQREQLDRITANVNVTFKLRKAIKIVDRPLRERTLSRAIDVVREVEETPLSRGAFADLRHAWRREDVGPEEEVGADAMAIPMPGSDRRH